MLKKDSYKLPSLVAVFFCMNNAKYTLQIPTLLLDMLYIIGIIPIIM
jgi:hypothetical protein